MEFSHGKCVWVGSLTSGRERLKKKNKGAKPAVQHGCAHTWPVHWATKASIFCSFVCSYSDPLGPGPRHLDPLQHHGRRRRSAAQRGVQYRPRAREDVRHQASGSGASLLLPCESTRADTCLWPESYDRLTPSTFASRCNTSMEVCWINWSGSTVGGGFAQDSRMQVCFFLSLCLKRINMCIELCACLT